MIVVALLACSGCAGDQSALIPASHQAQWIAQLWWWMLGGAIIIWLFMVVLTYYAIFAKRQRFERTAATWMVIGGGVLFPTLVLTILLCFGLSLLPPLLARPPAGSMVIDVEGVQWWWRVRYPSTELADQTVQGFETANEIWIPVDQPVEFRLRSHDVIHSFWIPALGGKVDMIPGRVTRLSVLPFRIGRYRGACAEYCGESHALMNFDVRVVSQTDFEKWLIRQASNAQEANDEKGRLGQDTFQANGCGACHAVRGTAAKSTVGPDLTHFGSRHSLGAGIYSNNRESVMAWLRTTEQIKPGVHMPNFYSLSEPQLDALTAYLEQLQ